VTPVEPFEIVASPEITRLRFGPPRQLPENLLHVIAEYGDPLWDAGAQFVYEEYFRRGWCSVSSKKRVPEHEPWAEESVYHLIIDADEGIVGTLRTVVGKFTELPIGSQYPRLGEWPPDMCCEFGEFVVASGASKLQATSYLHRSALEVGVKAGAQTVVAVVETPLLRLLREGYGFPFVQVGEGHQYMGAECIPIATTYRDIADSIFRLDLGMYDFLFRVFTPEEIARNEFPIYLP
jgi:N-acyl-L-homoserine lactone synthetase